MLCFGGSIYSVYVMTHSEEIGRLRTPKCNFLAMYISVRDYKCMSGLNGFPFAEGQRPHQ